MLQEPVNQSSVKKRRKRGVFRDVINEFLHPNATVTTSDGLIIAGVMTVILIPLIFARGMPEIGLGEAPPSSIQPGSRSGYGGGFIDDLSNPLLGEALSLVPEGLHPVAVFPPFAYQRTVPAIAVVFSEARKSILINLRITNFPCQVAFTPFT